MTNITPASKKGIPRAAAVVSPIRKPKQPEDEDWPHCRSLLEDGCSHLRALQSMTISEIAQRCHRHPAPSKGTKMKVAFMRSRSVTSPTSGCSALLLTGDLATEFYRFAMLG